MAKPKEKSPAFQLYAKEWLSCPHVMRMLPEQEGAYIHLLCFDWQEDGLLDDMAVLVHLSRIPQDKLEFVLEKFKPHPRKNGWLTHPRLEKERKKQKAYKRKKSQSGKAGANKRWGTSGNQRDTGSKKDSGANGGAKKVPMANDSSPSPIPSPIPSSNKSNSINTITCTKLIELFKDYAPSMPKPLNKMQAKRKKELLARFKDLDEDETAWIEFCKKIEASDFVTSRKADQTFRPGLDWVLKPEFFTKIMEGNYDNDRDSRYTSTGDDLESLNF